MTDISYFAKSNHRNQQRRFGIKQADRARHIYCLGKTGVGKSTLLKHFILQDIHAGRGVGLLDPHGSLAEEVLAAIPRSRFEDLVYFDPADLSHAVGLNLLICNNPDERSIMTGNLLDVFKRLWADSWGPRMEHYLRFMLLSLMEQDKPSLMNLFLILNEPERRDKLVEAVKDPIVQRFWKGEFNQHQQRYLQEAISPIQNKVGKLVASVPVRHCLSQAHAPLDLGRVMNEEQIFIANLSKGRLGEDDSQLLGSLLSTTFLHMAMQRASLPEVERKAFHLVIDEFHNFTSDALCNILSEARKYGLSLLLAHQYIAQLKPSIRDAVFGNVGTLISFAVGADDAEHLEAEFKPHFDREDVVQLQRFEMILKLMIDGMTSAPFSAMSLPPQDIDYGLADKGLKRSQARVGRSRKKVEGEINHQLGS